MQDKQTKRGAMSDDNERAPSVSNSVEDQTIANAVKLLAQLLAGCPIQSKETVAPEPYAALIKAVLAMPAERLQAFEQALGQFDSAYADAIRREIFAEEPVPISAAPPKTRLPDPVAHVPPLPISARLEGDPLELLGDHWIGQYCAFARKAANMSPMAFHLANGLAAGAAALARRVCLRWSTQSIYPNLYILIVAPSTLYHKTTALNLLRMVLKQAGLGELLLPDMQTPESLVMEMGLTKPPTFDSWPRTEQQQWQESRRFAGQRLWLLDEAGRLLDSFKRDHTAGLLSLLLSLYDCPEREMVQTVARGRQAIVNGYLSFVGATTPDAIRAYLRHSKHWSDGLWARFALVGKPETLPAFQMDTESYEPPAQLIEHLHTVAFSKLGIPQVVRDSDGMRVDWPAPVMAELTPEACAAWQHYAKATGYDLLKQGQVDEMLFSPYGRLATTALKVALILAALDADIAYTPTLRVQLRHWHIAQLIVEGWRAGLHRLIGETQQTGESRMEDRIVALVRSQRNLTRRDLMRQLHCRRDDLIKTLYGMVNDGMLIETRISNGHGPATLTYELPRVLPPITLHH